MDAIIEISPENVSQIVKKIINSICFKRGLSEKHFENTALPNINRPIAIIIRIFEFVLFIAIRNRIPATEGTVALKSDVIVLRID